MKKYEVLIIETLCKRVEVEAIDKHEAKAIVNNMYRTGKVILTADDFDSYDLECLGTCKNKE